MNALKSFTLPLKGLKNGTHQFDFQVDRVFFAEFPQSPIAEGELSVNLLFDKRPEMIVLDFDLSGHVKTDCDRCNAPILLPLKAANQLVVKFTIEEKEEEDDVLYLPWETSELNVARFVYEYIILAMPMIKTYDCDLDEQPPCNFENLDYLDNFSADTQESKEEKVDNPIWAELKKKFNKDN